MDDGPVMAHGRRYLAQRGGGCHWMLDGPGGLVGPRVAEIEITAHNAQPRDAVWLHLISALTEPSRATRCSTA